MSELVSIVYKPREMPVSEQGYTRIPLQEARLIEGYGIADDEKGGGKRQLNIMSAEVVQTLGSEGFQVEPGALGEQLIITGIDVNALPVGSRIQIGEAACVEMVEPRTGCAKFKRHQGKEPQLASGRIGMMAKVVSGGTIRVGDPVTLLTLPS